MKISIITKQFNFRGGSSNYVYEVARRITSKGHRVFIYTSKYNGDRVIEGIDVVKVPVLKTGFFLKTMSFAYISEWMAKREGFDILQGHGNNIKQDILTVQNCYLATKLSQGIKTGSLNSIAMIEKMQFSKGNYKIIVSPSNMVKQDIIRLYSVPATDITVIPRGVDSERYHPRNRTRYGNEKRRKIGIKDDERVILFVSSGDFANRGLNHLIKAISILLSQGMQRIKLVVIGGDKLSNKYRSIAEKEGIDKNILFLPFSNEIERYYNVGDVLVFPTHYDSFGQVVTEAMASGIAVIVSSKAGVSEQIKDGMEGIILNKPTDAHEIANAIRLLLDNPERKKKMAINGRHLAETLSWDRVFKSMMAIYNESNLTTKYE